MFAILLVFVLILQYLMEPDAIQMENHAQMMFVLQEFVHIQKIVVDLQILAKLMDALEVELVDTSEILQMELLVQRIIMNVRLIIVMEPALVVMLL